VGLVNTSTNLPSDAAIIRLEGSRKHLALTVDCNARYVWADPLVGGQIAVAEAARNIVVSGGEPSAITNCLNFGNPYQPEVYWQFVNAIKGMGDACRKFNTPVTGGNVSFYNQNPDGPVYPTPTIGMVGLLENVNDKMTLDFKQAGDVIVLLGKSSNDINSSEYLHKMHGVEFSPAPQFELEEEFHLQKVLADLIKNKLISSAHDVSEGGLFITLCESAFWNNLGFDVNTNASVRKDAFLFGEAQSRVAVTVKKDALATLEEALQSHGQHYEVIGEVTSGDIIVDAASWGTIEAWKEKYDNAIANLLKGHESEHALSAL